MHYLFFEMAHCFCTLKFFSVLNKILKAENRPQELIMGDYVYHVVVERDGYGNIMSIEIEKYP